MVYSVVVLLANISSVEKVMQALNDFEKYSGLKMWIGKKRNSLETPLGLGWCSGVKTLGIHFSCEDEQVIQQNFHDRLNDCK